jgi:hypothetical protein
VVAAALVGALGLTIGLLVLLSPTPLAPDISGRLFVSDSAPRSFDFSPVFQTRQPAIPGRWTAIYIHHSKTPAGNASTLAEAALKRGISGPADHFIIGNGQGMGDGEVQFTPRWDDQLPAAPPAPGSEVESGWISICLVGDFDEQRPTEAQMQRLRELVWALQEGLKLNSASVVRLEVAGTAAGLGRLFGD